MATYADFAEWLLAYLKTVSAVTTLVMDGASGIIESGELIAKDIEDAERARLEDEVTHGSKVLRVMVQDLGEFPFEGNRFAQCAVYICDRRKGYANMRSVREQVLSSVVARSVALDRSSFLKKVRFYERSGHGVFVNYDLEYEQVVFRGLVTPMETDLYS